MRGELAKLLFGNGVERTRQRLAGARIDQIRIQFEQRFQHKSPAEHARMWDLKFRRLDHVRAIEQNVEVDQTGSAALLVGPNTPRGGLDLVNPAEQCKRVQTRAAFDNLVQEPRLIGDVLRLGFAQRGSAQDIDTGRGQPL
jgi:hypothetical protein